jgi:Tfp pilus assembly protein PilN
MIEINLLPQELKVKESKGEPELKNLLYLIPLILAVLIFIHLVLGVTVIFKKQQLAFAKKKWQSFEAQRKTLEDLKSAYGMLSQDAKLIQQLSGQRVLWAEKLNKLSLLLPSGVWLDEFSFSQKDLTLRCSVISLQKEEMALINNFMESLRKQEGFMKDFSKLELGSVQRRVVGGYEIVDFVLTATLK